MKPICKLLLVGLLLASFPATASAQTVIFQENFDQLSLRPPVDEDSGITQAFTHIPPSNWRVDSSDVPGIQNPSVGVFEWEGWSFADKDFWIEVSNDELRSKFTRGQGTVAVADPDEWNDLGNPANNVGFYNAFLETPFFDINSILTKGDRLKLKFDSSWRPQCCDDGEQFAPNENNQTATIRAKFEDGSTVELLRWESAPFLFEDTAGVIHPSTNPNHEPNPFFKDIDLDELLFVDLSSLLTTNHLGFLLEFGLTNAGDDYWWAMDTIQAVVLEELDGDMDLNGVLEEADIDDFVQAMHSTKDYIATHFGEHPAKRGSSANDGFDFDDIDWFVSLFNAPQFAVSRDTVLAAIEAQAIPEPTSGSLAVVLLGIAFTRRRHRLRDFV